MKRPGRLILLSALLLGLEAVGIACISLPEEMRVGYADTVIDGVATCDVDRGECLLRAHEIIKHDARRRDASPIYRLRFRPGANRRLAKAMAKKGELMMCAPFWEPRSSHIEGRFYLHRDRGHYRARQESAKGERPPEEGGDD